MSLRNFSGCDDSTKNIVIASLAMSICAMAATPAGAVQNIALAESTEIGLNVGYYTEVSGVVAVLSIGVCFSVFYKLIGIKLAATLAVLLTTGYYWTMIWIVNQYLMYFGGFLSGMGHGLLWIICPMTVMDNSKDGNAQRNMGYFWVAKSVGEVIGGVCTYIYFNDVTRISKTNRIIVYSVCAGVTIIAAVTAAVGMSEVKHGKNGHVPLEDRDIVQAENEEECLDADEVFVKEVSIEDPHVQKSVEYDVDLSQFDHSIKYAKAWFKVMGKRSEFWVLLLPLFYWAFIWGFFYKILPTATASISDERKLIPLTTIIIGVSYLLGSVSWIHISKLTNNTACIISASVIHLTALVLSVLILPKGAATEILDVDEIDTYIKPEIAYVVVIFALIGFADSGISIIFYTTAGKIFGEGTSLGYAVTNNIYCLFYIASMFAPSLFDLHSYCYTTMAAVLVMCVSMTVGLKKFI